jgi:hypothetical protein
MKKDLLLESFVNSGLSAENMKQTNGGYCYKLVSATGNIFCCVGDNGSTYFDTLGRPIYAGNADSVLA